MKINQSIDLLSAQDGELKDVAKATFAGSDNALSLLIDQLDRKSSSLDRIIEVTNKLIEAGAPLDKKSAGSATIFHNLTRMKSSGTSVALAKLFVSRGADHNAPGAGNLSAFEYAIDTMETSLKSSLGPALDFSRKPLFGIFSRRTADSSRDHWDRVLEDAKDTANPALCAYLANPEFCESMEKNGNIRFKNLGDNEYRFEIRTDFKLSTDQRLHQREIGKDFLKKIGCKITEAPEQDKYPSGTIPEFVKFSTNDVAKLVVDEVIEQIKVAQMQR